jgi:hypothetical protein
LIPRVPGVVEGFETGFMGSGFRRSGPGILFLFFSKRRWVSPAGPLTYPPAGLEAGLLNVVGGVVFGSAT